MIFEMPPILVLLALPLLSFILSIVAVPFVRKYSLKVDFVDRPGGRKQHEKVTPYGGGIAIFAVFGFLSIFIAPPFENSWAYFLALAMILVTGVIDDKRGVNAKLKFAIHFLSAFILVIPGHTQLATLGDLLGFGNMGLGWAVVPFSVACVVYIINAINMMDGVDGLAGGNCLIIFCWLLIACFVAGEWEVFLSLGLLCGAILGFLVYNMRNPLRRKAAIFLGDAGSMALGLTIAWYCIHLSQQPIAIIPPVSVAWIIALPIVDAFGLLVARLSEGKHPFEPDRRHFHHHFLDAGFSPAQTTIIILTWSAILGGIGYLGLQAGIEEPVLGWAWVSLWIGHAVMTMYPKRFTALLTKTRSL
ncbi:MAG: undecaprenyl/decaprenyl-phosphate alpha-N-acetylglucosaminyl 1-phosphate transferase [Micavibrio aeruginosavorus]|uniref:Undecaprenyl/decaprenyl-phosphate alpha-N-acetylglucosaminyl 1-phosphate transferase n=1 Tax=Micavibrio aeruginosavorus TaxID=349221 RepID=A0A2W5FGE8_9BACT|nr:MAG: undecaprenyl/decaprenyl-phosphate alpha-N-acetylglucosaminyl 1-phosphate transferase [Micavibrio aeruginosavorus]